MDRTIEIISLDACVPQVFRYAMTDVHIGAVLVRKDQIRRIKQLEDLILTKVAQRGTHSWRGKVKIVGARELKPNTFIRWCDPDFSLEP